MGIHFIDICERETQHQPASELDLLRDEVERLKAKRAYDAWHMRHIRRILRAIDMPTSTQGTLSTLAIASPAWRVLLLAKTAIALCKERDATRDLISAVDGLMDYRRRNRHNWQSEKADDYFRLIEAAREGISLGQSEPITEDVITQVPA